MAAWTASTTAWARPGADASSPPSTLRRVVRLSRAPTSGRCARPPGRPTRAGAGRRRPACARTRGADPAHHWKSAPPTGGGHRWATEALAGNPEVQQQFVAAVHAAACSRGPRAQQDHDHQACTRPGCTCASWAAGWRRVATSNRSWTSACCGRRARPVLADPGSLTDEIRRATTVPKASVAGAPFILEASVPALSQWRPVARRRSRWPRRHRPVGDPGCPGVRGHSARRPVTSRAGAAVPRRRLVAHH